jgi:O-antigen/teichoic acid export membrane protein
MALVADLLIPVALGPEWDAAIHPLQLLCLYSAFLSSQTLNSHVLLWTGQFRANMWCSILVLVTMPLVLFGAVQHGLVGVGLAWAVVFPVLNLPAFYYSFRTINLKTSEWLDSLKPASVGCLVMTGTVLGIRALLPGSVPLIARTAAAVITGAITYPATIWFLFPARVKQIVDVARSVRSAEPAAAIVELPLDKSDEDD